MPLAATWLDVESVRPSERSQRERRMSHDIIHT